MEMLVIPSEVIQEVEDPGKTIKNVSFLCITSESTTISASEELFHSLSNSSSVEDQVNLVRSFQLKDGIPGDSKIELFVRLYLLAPLKHAVRGALVK